VNNGKAPLTDAQVRQFLEESLGEDGCRVVRILREGDRTDEELAEAAGIKLNTVRKILYKLYDYRLAFYTRVKDKETGWYIYTWRLNLENAFRILEARKRIYLDELMKRLEFEQTHVFFCCENDNCKVPFDVASEQNFRCPQCAQQMNYVDNQSVLMGLRNEIDRIKREINNGGFGSPPQEGGMS
jgi:transcription initiation factor TFIIE subunit alpha